MPRPQDYIKTPRLVTPLVRAFLSHKQARLLYRVIEIPQLWITLGYHIVFKKYLELAPCVSPGGHICARRGAGGHMLKCSAFQGDKRLPACPYR